MKLLTLDLEMNKPSDKIIEIGYVISDTRSQSILFERSLLVNPQEALSLDIVELTGITDKMLSQAPTLGEAYSVMKQDCIDYGVTTLFAQWGVGDTDCLRAQLGLTWDEFICRKRAIDVKSIYQGYAAISGITTKKGLAGACRQLGLEFKGREHRATDDARNTWYVMKELCNKMVCYDNFENVLKKAGKI